jgi:gentisate 1,2-dioxygenase
MSLIDPRERAAAHAPTRNVDFYAEALRASAQFRTEYDGRMNVVKAHEMPFERSPNGLIKHIINEKMNTKECCLDIYMQFLPAGKASGKHRHLSEEVFYVVEGEGYDLHWDVRFDCNDKMEFDWESEPKKFEWKQGDFVYIPPYCAHKHFNSSAANEARIIVVNSRIVKPMGFDWFEQIENAEGF